MEFSALAKPPISTQPKFVGRRWLWVIAARLVQSGRQEEQQVSISDGWAKQLRDEYRRLLEWIRSIAPQFNNLVHASTPGGVDFALPIA